MELELEIGENLSKERENCEVCKWGKKELKAFSLGFILPFY
jgi:hypothetical protein